MCCESSITIVWTLNVFINDFTLPYQHVNENKSVLLSKECPTCAYSQSVSTFTYCWLPPYPTVNLKSFSCNGKS